jgi:hypothetical protein
LYAKELYKFYFPPNTVRMINLRRLRKAEHVGKGGRDVKCLKNFTHKNGKRLLWKTNAGGRMMSK